MLDFVEEPFDQIAYPSRLCGHHQDPMPKSGIGLKQTWPNRVATSQFGFEADFEPKSRTTVANRLDPCRWRRAVQLRGQFLQSFADDCGMDICSKTAQRNRKLAAARFLIPARSGSPLCRRCPRRITVASTGSPSGRSFFKRHDIACEHSYFVRAP